MMDRLEQMRSRFGFCPLVGMALVLGACSGPVPDDQLVGNPMALEISGVTFQTVLQRRFVGAENNGGGAVNATATLAQAWERFSIEDINGGTLESGDRVHIRAGNGQFFQALNGGGSSLNAASNNRLEWEIFTLDKESGGGPINNGDVVGIQAWSGNWVSAENGGGGPVFAYGGALGPWERFVFGSGSPSTGPTNPGSGFASILDEGMFNGMFPARNGFYTYAGLVNAAATFGAFANSGDIATRKREVAAFLANVGHETGDLVFIEEINKADYCAPSGSCPCAPGKRYFGRGPLQLSWNFNYCTVGAAIGIDLRADPDRVARDPTVAWQTGLWFWMTSGGAGFRPAHDSIVNGNGFGETIRTINGSLECNGGNPGAVQSRINRYLDFCSRLGVDPGGNQGC